ncbi:hypothetical protein N752_23205 [Desulforamulus aquiferis]|nr:hypothetical protein [Desulforamulus aquiferis]RYD02690.1 hypothetical protein N752_23205 [Desulforamulus aquiferis]
MNEINVELLALIAIKLFPSVQVTSLKKKLSFVIIVAANCLRRNFTI